MPARVLHLGLVALAAASANAQVDLVITDLPDVLHKGPVGSVHGYSVGFTVCNAGAEPAAWQSQTNQHPVEAWNLYRIAAGRIEHIGASWVKHGNFAASVPGCGPCDTRINGNRLGPGCRDIYNATYNSSAFGLGARADINPATGYFPYPPTGWGQTGSVVFKLAQVEQSDLSTPEAIYVAEGIIAHPQDAAAGNALNNASYRRVVVNPGTFDLVPVGDAVPASPAIFAWRDLGRSGQPDPDVFIAPADIPRDGRFWIASKATRLDSGLWRYEYAVENLSSHRALAGFSVSLPLGSPALGPEFHDVNTHSGDPLDSTDWAFTRSACAARWETTPFAIRPNANALRWGSLFNFRLESPFPPVQGSVALALFRPGTPESVHAGALVPGGVRSADFNADGFTDGFDYDSFVACFEGHACPADQSADFNRDGFADGFDFDDFVTAFELGC